jgi:hypothetical protein
MTIRNKFNERMLADAMVALKAGVDAAEAYRLDDPETRPMLLDFEVKAKVVIQIVEEKL